MPVNYSSAPGRANRNRLGELAVGRLAEHGAAPYQFERGESLSYYVTLITDRGPRTLWGTDLARAITKSATKVRIGDVVGARRTGADPVRIANGPPGSSAPERIVRRNRWVVERVRFFTERARLARRARDDHNDARAALKERPELKSGFLTMRAARAFAERRIPNAEDRERFLQGVQSAIDGSILKGMPLPDIRIREKTATSSAPSKRLARERSR